ncbi:MAG: pilus assembly protein Flp/PilA [Alphaproteobacteria bacterium]|jgi:pilus assembly protein Flp/PilA
MSLISNFFKEESGVAAIEYCLIAAVISLAIIGAMGTLSSELTAKFEEIATTLQDAS